MTKGFLYCIHEQKPLKRILPPISCAPLLLLLVSACGMSAPELVKQFNEREVDGSVLVNGTYGNPYLSEQHGSLWGYLRARFSSGKWARYDPAHYRVPTAKPNPATSSEDAVTTTWVGHATVLLQYRGINVLTDPIFSQRASPLAFAGPKRITQAALIPEQMPPIDVVVISHNHYDHLDAPSIRQLGNHPRYFVPLGIKAWLVSKGIDDERITEMDWWQSASIEINGDTLTITATPSQHFSGRGLLDRNKTLWASWHIAWQDYQAWFAGDTGYNEIQFREIGLRFPNIDLGIIPIGAYKPRWFMGGIHVNPTSAVRIHRDIGANYSLGIHWGTFILTAEEIDEPPRLLAETLAKSKLPADAFTVYAVGESRRYPIAR